MFWFYEILQKLWKSIITYLLVYYSHAAAETIEPGPYENAWNAVFKTYRWLECVEEANIFLIGDDLDRLSDPATHPRPHLVLAFFDPTHTLEDTINIFHDSLRRDCYSLDYESETLELEQLTLTVREWHVPEVLGKDFSFLFSKDKQILQTKYCYWNDPDKEIRVLDARSKNIRGIGGSISEARELRPIFLLNLVIPAQALSEQIVLRVFGGGNFSTNFSVFAPPLVKAIREGGPGARINKFLFKHKKYKTLDRQIVNWIGVAENECNDCSYIY